MYFKTLCLTALISLNYTASAKKKHIADKLDVVAVDVKQQGDSINLDILFQVNSEITPSESIELTPFLTKSEKTGIFPSLILNGKQRQKIQKRDYSFMSLEERKKTIEAGTRYLEVTTNPFIYTYNGKIAYEDWMREAALDLSVFGCRCGKTEISSFSRKEKEITSGGSKKKEDKNKNPEQAQEGSNQIRLQSNIELPGPYDALIPLLKVAEIKPYVYDRDHQEIKYEIQFDYEASKTTVNENFKNNKGSMSELKHQIKKLIDNGAHIKQIYISGYASPEGTYEQNMRISQKRSEAFGEQLKTHFGFNNSQFVINWYGEDWEGLKKLLHANVTNYRDEALLIIEKTGIFQGREKKLMDLFSGNAYRHMSEIYFPLLRRIEFRVIYSKTENNIDKIRELYQTSDDQLTINDFNLLLSQEKFATQAYRSLLTKILERYPNDETAVLNMAAICLIDNKPEEAWNFLKRKHSKKRILEFENNLGVYYLMTGNRKNAIRVFENAAGEGYDLSNQNLEYIIN